MTDEYFVAVKNFNLSWAELCQLGRNSLTHAFLDDTEKQSLLDDFEAALARFEKSINLDQAELLDATTYGYGHRYLGLKNLGPPVPTEGTMPIIRGFSAV